MKRGFTLLELIVVIIIIGILAALGLVQYTTVVEKGRTAEAKAILGQLRTAQIAYYQENGAYTATIANLIVVPPITCTQITHYFQYSSEATNGTGTATRCLTGTGKTPGVVRTYYITLTIDGIWSGTAGYY